MDHLGYLMLKPCSRVFPLSFKEHGMMWIPNSNSLDHWKEEKGWFGNHRQWVPFHCDPTPPSKTVSQSIYFRKPHPPSNFSGDMGVFSERSDHIAKTLASNFHSVVWHNWGKNWHTLHSYHILFDKWKHRQCINSKLMISPEQTSTLHEKMYFFCSDE